MHYLKINHTRRRIKTERPRLLCFGYSK